MKVPGSGHRLRRALAAALLSGLFVSLVFVLFNWTRFLVAGGGPGDPGRLLLGVLSGSVVSLAWQVPFLLAVLFVVGSGANPRAVAAGGALVYVAGLLLNAGSRLLRPFPVEGSLAVLVVPLPRVWRLLGIAAAVWIVYGGGYERLTGPFEHAEHPLYAVLVDRTVAGGLDLRRGLLAAVVGGAVGAAGLVLSGVLYDVLTVASTGTTIRFSTRTVGVPLAEVPTTFLAEAAFLLAVVLVAGSRTTARVVLAGVAVVLAVGIAVAVAPALVPPFGPVDLWQPGGPLLGPLGDAVLVVGIAAAVWLAFHGGVERLRERTPRSSAAG